MSELLVRNPDDREFTSARAAHLLRALARTFRQEKHGVIRGPLPIVRLGHDRLSPDRG